MKTSTIFRPIRLTAGFSLVELLTVIAIIGIIAFILIPTLGVRRDEVKRVQAQRNAQTIATVAANAQAAGDASIETSPNLATAVAKVKIGVVGTGAFANMKFAVSQLTPEEVADAIKHLSWDGDQILYSKK